MVFNGLDNVALPVHLKQFLGDHGVRVVEGHVDVANVTVRSVDVRRVTEGALVVRYGPGGGGHNAEVVVAIRDQTTDECVLGGHVGLAD